MAHLLRQRTVSLLALLAGCAVLPAAVVHFFGETYLDIETRILAVCDVFDALLSKPVYRPAWTIDRALELLSTQSGTCFDPACVEALERVIARERHDGARAVAA